LPTLQTAKYCAVCYLQIAAHLHTVKVAGSNPAAPTHDSRIAIVHGPTARTK
jgi:hypothetical protein